MIIKLLPFSLQRHINLSDYRYFIIFCLFFFFLFTVYIDLYRFILFMFWLEIDEKFVLLYIYRRSNYEILLIGEIHWTEKIQWLFCQFKWFEFFFFFCDWVSFLLYLLSNIHFLLIFFLYVNENPYVSGFSFNDSAWFNTSFCIFAWNSQLISNHISAGI